ncbi:hypothetical protein D4764_17G0006920 [Takifugu flavidus]|uniref:Reverse transcriptase domain-containing protein n=1 Tax=Takifugu flavidus TaxID=433684 RepID=A0A5C6NX45_9TELE|nr:hypothetical protein D4764_17G0006920 [Takifugu flavidus]
MCFVDLEMAFDRVPRGVLWGGPPRMMLPSSARDLQRSLDRCPATCEAAGMRISTSKSAAMVLNRKVECLFRVEEALQVEEFKYLGVLFTSEGRKEQETGGSVQRQQ